MNVLKHIGWNISPHDKDILCDGTDVLGYGSVYKNYNFTLNDAVCNSADAAIWEYQIYDNLSRSYKTLNTYKGTVFHVEPHIIAKSLDEYQCVQARVTAKNSGKEYHFPLTMETRPFIEDINISNIRPIGNRQYQFSILIRQRGATRGTVLVSDDSGSIHEYDFNGDVINVSGLIENLNAYIDVSLENEYGSASRLIQGRLYSGKESIVSIRNDNNAIKAENNSGIKTLHNQDIITMTLPDNIADMSDSIKWYLCVDDVYKELCTKKNGEKSCTFKVTQEMLDFKYSRDSEENKLRFVGGESWGNRSWETSGLTHFVAKAYRHDNNGAFTQSYVIEDVIFDVLPSEPVIKVSDVWTDEDDYDYPHARISFDISNYDHAAVYVYVPQTYRSAIPTNIWMDTTFVAGGCDEYTINFGGWANRVYCKAYNRYGSHKGHMVGFQNTGIENNITNNPRINVYNNTVEVKHDTDLNITIHTIDGKIICNRKKTRHFIKTLSPGYYVIKLENIKYKSSITKKIIIQ